MALVLIAGWSLGLVCGQAEEVSESAESSLPPRQATAAEMTQREIDRRREVTFRLNENLDLAERLYQAGEWELAQGRFRQVMQQTDPQTATSGFYQRARTGVAKSLAAQALAQEKAGKNAEAAGLMKQAADLDPTNPMVAKQSASMQEQAARLADPYEGNVAVTNDLVERTKEIKKLLSWADQLSETGQYRDARRKLDDVLRIDHYNFAATAKIEKLEQKRIISGDLRHAATREKALAQVTEAWNPPMPAVLSEKGNRTTGSSTSSDSAKILKSLASIKIPELVFNEKPIRAAVEELRRLSEQYDPEKKGLNIVLRLSPATTGVDPESATVSLELRDVNLQTVLKYLCEQIRGGEKLRFQVENSAVLLLPLAESGGQLETRSYNLPPSLVANLGKADADPKKMGDQILANIGADTTIKDSSAICFRDTAKLVVRNTASEHAKLEQILRDSSNEESQKQFEIESKFLSFTENDLKNFTFNYNVSANANIPPSLQPGGTPTPIGFGTQTTGLRGTSALDPNGVALAGLKQLLDPNNLQANSNQIGINGQIYNKGFAAILQLLQNALGKDLVAAPRVTCADGKDSTIIIAREMRYPTSYTQPTVPNNDTGGGSGFILPANPTGFEPRNVGVILKVNAASTSLPTAVDIKIDNLEVVDFAGFINYGTVINSITYGTFTTPPTQGASSQSPYLVPIFSRKALTTQIRMLDGQTFAIGGLIAEADQMVDDKVPILGDLPVMGRFFRSEVSQKVKNNLVVFTTVRIIKPDGTLVNPEDDQNPEYQQSGSGEMMSAIP
jgi:general secretion pathway protein D